MVCGVSLILQNATCSAEAACSKDVVQGRQWKSNYSLRRPYDLTEGFPVLVCTVDVPCSDTVGLCEDTFNATVVKRLKQLGRQVVSLQYSQEVEPLLCFLDCGGCVTHPFQVL